MESSNFCSEKFIEEYNINDYDAGVLTDDQFVANYFEEEFDTAVDNMSSLIEPIMIVFMGTMIGGLMIAMYSPIFNVGAIIGQ